MATLREIGTHLAMSDTGASNMLRTLGLARTAPLDEIRLAYIQHLKRGRERGANREALTAVQVERETLKLRRETGALVDRKDAISSFARLVVEVKTRLLATPVSAAKEANPADPHRAEQAFRTALYDALRSFDADTITRLLSSGESDA